MQFSHIALLILELLTSRFEPLAAVHQKSEKPYGKSFKNIRRYPTKCTHPTETGKCKGSFPSFYFDVHTKRCEEFIYGGCGGNANNFMDPVDCIWECERFDLLPEKCKASKNKGRGRKFSVRYFYDFKNRKCTSFFYKGSGGNRNNFLSIKQCTGECAEAVRMPKKCKLPVVKGPCGSYIRRYYYNTRTKRCELFIYGGCRGNKNNFKERTDCIRECQSYAPHEDYDPKLRMT